MKPHLLILFLILVLVGCTQNQADSSAPKPTNTPAAVVDTALVQHGIEIYKTQYCGICHQLTAAHTAGTFGPSHDGVATRALEHIQSDSYSGTATTAAEYFRESLLDPQRYIVEGYAASSHQMPTYTFLTTEDVDALVYMLLQQQ